MYLIYQYLLLAIASLFHLIVSLRERETLPPPGKLIDINGHKIHFWVKGTGDTTVIFDHSLGGIEGSIN